MPTSEPSSKSPSTSISDRPSKEARRLACHIARLMDDSNCERVRVLNLAGISPVTDLFVIATGTSDRQMSSVLDDVIELAVEEGFGKGVSDGQSGGGWVVVDFFDVMVHLFTEQMRAYYDLESLWGDAQDVDWRSVTKPGRFAHVSAEQSHRLGYGPEVK